MWTAESVIECRGASRANESSSTIESTPPESAMATLAPSLTYSASAAPRAVSTAPIAAVPSPGSTGGDFLELAIAEQLVFARLEQRVERLPAHVAQRLGQTLLERGHHRSMIAMRAAQRL